MSRKARTITIIIFSAVLSVLMAFGALLLGVSHNYHKAYDMRELRGGVIDMGGFDQTKNQMYNTLSGEWEFFYNRWIVTGEESLDQSPDGFIQLPGGWTSKEFPAEGYASFRIRVQGAEAGAGVSVYCANSPYAYNVFINGCPAGVSGAVSTDASETFCSGYLNEVHPYTVSESETLEIVIELSATRDGGFYGLFWLRIEHRDEMYDTFLKFISRSVIGVILAYVAFSVVMIFAFRGSEKKQIAHLFLILSVFFHLAVSKEVWEKICTVFPLINYAVIFQMQFLSGVLLLPFFAFQLIRKRLIKLGKAGAIFIAAVCALGAALFYILRGTDYRILSAAFPAAGFVYVLYLLAQACALRRKESILHLSMLCFLIGMFIGESLDIFGYLLFGMENITSLLLMMFVVPFTLSSLYRIRNSAIEAQKAAELRFEISTVKQAALRAQIKPHFIFNALTAIEALYRKDLKEGEAAMEKFARHLRLNVDADKKDLVPFGEELDNILNYFELENMRLDNKLTLLLDIAYTDFDVPILSLQPLVENAVKHAATHEREDGYIQIRSKLEDGNVIVEVADNGKGFDTGRVREGAAGLRNISERLKFMVDAQISISSAQGQGTTVSIVFPKKESR